MNNILVIDVETAGDFSNPLVYDIGYKIIDRAGTEYATRSFIINEIFDNKILMDRAYYSKKIPLYYDKIRKKQIFPVSFFVAREILLQDIEKFEVKIIAAYNTAFDIGTLKNTAEKLTGQDWFTFFPKNLEYWDIWNMFCDSIAQRNTFRKFCIENNFISDAKNLRTSAEVAYRYFKKNTDFKEEHTGLADVKIETDLLLWILRQKKKVTKGIESNPWQKVAPHK